MLYKLGKVINKGKTYLIFESNYEGIIIHVTNVDKFEVDKFQKIFIYDYCNEYVHNYYGFKEFKERILFEDLLTIQGIGPKTALSILTKHWEEIIDLIASGDYDGLAKIPYVGLRTARQIVFDFQKKYQNFAINSKHESKNKIEVFKTLKTLGFNQEQINFVSNKIQDNDDIELMVEQAIEIISHEKRKSNETIEA